MSSGHDHLPGLPAEPERSRPGRESTPAHADSGRIAPFGANGSVVGLHPVPASPALNADPLALLKAFRRRWPLAIGLGLLTAGLAAGLAWLVIPPAKYTASTHLQIFAVRPTIIFETKEAATDFTTYQQTQVDLLKSRRVLATVLKDPKVAALKIVKNQEDAFEWLSNALQFQYGPRSEVIRISLSGDDPTELPVILNSVTDVYMNEIVEQGFQERLGRLRYLEQLYNKYQDDLKSSRNSLRELSDKAGGSDQDTLILKTQFALESKKVAERMKLEIQTEILEAQADLELLQHQVDEAPPPPLSPAASGPSSQPSLTDLERGDPVIRNIQAEIDRLSDTIKNTRRIAKKGNDPAIIPARARMAKLEGELNARRRELMDLAAQEGIDPTSPTGRVGDSPRERLAEVRQRLSKLQLIDRRLDAEIERASKEARESNRDTLDLKTEQDRVALADQVAQKVGTEVQSLKVELQAPKRVKVVDQAVEPKTKDEMKKVKATGAISLVAFFGMIGLVTLLEFRARRIGSVNEVVQNLGLPLVGALPALPSKSQRGLARRGGSQAERWRSRLVESIDATRTMLLHASRTESIRVVMITSALKGEGKTSLASHLATSLARAGRKTLLIDCDLRKPALHRLFDVPPEPGMCEILRGETEAAAVIHPTPAAELDVLTAGRCDPLALQMLAQEGARHLFDTLAKDYDFLIVDTSPVLPVADALLLGQQVDAVLFSIMHEVSCVPTVQQAYDRLASLNIRVLGAVVNGAGGSNYGYDGYAVYGQAATAGA
jgi:succinoglycan biosynthesis transport protein ExoP